MTAPTITAAPERRRAGRPTDHALTARILDTTADLLAEYGVEGAAMDTVAEVARCGKAGIYRRWTDRATFLAAVLAHAVQPVTYPEPRTPAGDLAAVVASRVSGPAGGVSAALLSQLGPLVEVRQAWGTITARTAADVAELIETHGLPASPGPLVLEVERLIAWHLVTSLAHAGRQSHPQSIRNEADGLMAGIELPF